MGDGDPDTALTHKSEETPAAPEGRRPSFLQVLLQALSAWNT